MSPCPHGRTPLGLRSRILLLTSLAAIIALAAALAAFAVALDRILLDSALTTTRAQADQAAQQLSGRQGDARRALDAIPTQGAVLQLLDANGSVVGWSDPAAASQPLAGLRPIPGQADHGQVLGITPDDHDPYVVVAVGLKHPGPDRATILLVASPIQTDTHVVHTATAALGVLALLMLAGLLWLISRVLSSALGRVEDIRSSVASIQAAGLDARVPVPEGNDEITQLATTMNDMLDRLASAEAAQRSFVSDASHELRSPLTTIRMISETSPEGIDPDSTEVVAAEARRLQGLVDDLLTLARADDHGLSLTRTDVDIDDLLTDQVRRLRASTILDINADVQACRVLGDPHRLTQAINNLADNASRHALTSIRMACHCTPEHVVVQVDNDGAPIPADQREEVFGRFRRLHEARDRDSGGSGLGLAITRAIIRDHGGEVRAGESPEGWCRFEISLPALSQP